MNPVQSTGNTYVTKGCNDAHCLLRNSGGIVYRFYTMYRFTSFDQYLPHKSSGTHQRDGIQYFIAPNKPLLPIITKLHKLHNQVYSLYY